MTNEALAELIQQGDNDELLPVLWEKTAKLLYKMSAQKYALHKEALKQHGIEPEDLNQECYTVLLGAVKAYDSDKGYMLSTYFGYQFKQVLRKLLNGADVLDRIDTKSFDDPMTDEEDAPTRGDITPDPESGAGCLKSMEASISVALTAQYEYPNARVYKRSNAPIRLKSRTMLFGFYQGMVKI